MTTYADDKLTVGITGRKYPTDLEMKEIHPKIKYHRDAKEAASSLFALKGKEIKQQSVGNIKVQCYEKEGKGKWMYLSAAIDADDSPIAVDNGAAGVATGPVKVDDVLVLTKPDFSAQEQMRVTAVAENSLTVTRGYGSSDATSWADNTPVRNMGNASKEDSTTPTIKNVIPSEEYNVCCQKRTSMGGTYRFMESNFFADANKLAEMRLEKWIDHLDERVDKALFAERYIDTSDGTTVEEGIVPAILRRAGQHKVVNGNITFELFLEILADYVFKVGGSTKLAMMPPVMLAALAFWKRQNLLVMNDEEYLNLKVKRVEVAEGDLVVLRERRLQGGPLALRGLFGSCFVAVDPNNVTHCTFRNYSEKLLEHQEPKGYLGRIDEYISDDCFRWDVITSHSLVSQITGYE